MTSKTILSKYKKQGARIGTKALVRVSNKTDLALWYTPGVAAASAELARHPERARQMSIKKNSVAIISDGSAVLGLGNIGPYGALPVMEGKALIFKHFADIDAWPIVLDVHEPAEIIATVKAIAPAFGGINIEDIAAPQCFAIEEALVRDLAIPVMHDDQHGTAIVVLAGLLNAAKVVRKKLPSLKVVISGAGAAGSAIARLLLAAGVRDIVLLDRAGIVVATRADLSPAKRELARLTNPRELAGSLNDAIEGADAFIGVSGKGALKAEDVARMAPRGIVFALANPEPEIMPEEARRAGASVVATGRSDFPNQINNSLVFPGVFRGALDRGVRSITEASKLRAARALAALVARPTATKIVPDMFDRRVVKAVARSIR